MSFRKFQVVAGKVDAWAVDGIDEIQQAIRLSAILWAASSRILCVHGVVQNLSMTASHKKLFMREPSSQCWFCSHDYSMRRVRETSQPFA